MDAKSVKPITWSYSALRDFRLCPRKYYEHRVAKSIPYKETEATRYGDYVHNAIEATFKHGSTELPLDLRHIQGIRDSVAQISGVCSAEVKLAYTEEFDPCDYWSPQVWFRGKADLVILDADTLYLFDWKTGKNPRFADKSELEFFAFALGLLHPDVQQINAALVYLSTGDFITQIYAKEDLVPIMNKHLPDIFRLEQAYQAGVWNASPNFTCRRHCEVKDCPHNGR